MALQRIMPGWVPDMSACDSLENGVILLYNRVRAKADELDALMSKAREQTLGVGTAPLSQFCSKYTAVPPDDKETRRRLTVFS